MTINKAETHAATFLLVSIFSFLAAWHTRPADYICKMAKFFSRLGITCLAGGARLLDQGGGHKKLLHSLSPGWPPYSAGVHVSCTVYSAVYSTHHFPPSWLVAGCTVQSFSLQSGSNTSRPQLHSHIGHRGYRLFSLLSDASSNV